MDNFSNALSTYFQPENIYAWGEKLEDLHAFKSLKVANLGEFKVPLSLENIRRIQGAYENLTGDVIEIPNYDQIIEILATIAMSESMQIDMSSLNVNIKVTLSGMVICDEDAEHEERSNFRKGNGIAGNLILQLPIDLAHGGTHLSVDMGLKRKAFDFTRDTNTHFYLASIFGAKNMVNGAHYKISAPNKGPAVLMIFNLVWVDSILKAGCLAPTRLPGFIKAGHAVSSCLSDCKAKHVGENTSVCLPLKNNYHETCFDFCTLDNMDKTFTEVLRSVRGADVGLAVLKKEQHVCANCRTPCLRKQLHQITVERMIFEQTVSKRDLSCNSHYEIVGDLDAELTGNPTNMGVSRHPAFVIRLSTSIADEIDRIGLDEVINRLRDRLFETQQKIAKGKQSGRAQLLADIHETVVKLDQVVSYEILESEQSSLPNVLRCLLDFCFRLDATDEGVLVIDFVTKKLPFTFAEFIFSEGDIQKGFNELIVEFICSVSGWKVCSEMFRAVVERKFSSQACNVLCDLAARLLNVACYEGAAQIVDEMIQKLVGTSFDDFQKGNFALHALPLANLVKQMAKADCQVSFERYKHLETVLSKLTFSQMCHLLEQSEKATAENWSSMEEWRSALCLAITASTFDTFDSSQIHHLTTSYHNERVIVEALWLRLCSQIVDEVKSRKQASAPSLEDYFVTEITCPERCALLAAISENPIVKETFDAVVESFVKKSKRDENTEKVLSYYSLVMFADKRRDLANDDRVDSFCTVFTQLSSEKLCNLNWKMYDDDHVNIKHRSTSLKIFSCLCSEILSRDLWTVMKSSAEFPEVASNIIWMKDPELIDLLLSKVFEAAKSAYAQHKPLEIAQHLSKLIMFIEKRDAESGGLLAVMGETKVCSFLYIWFNSIIKVIQEKKFDETTADLFLQVLVRLERRQLLGNQEPIFEKYAELASKVPLILVKRIAIGVFTQEFEHQTVLEAKKYPFSWKIFNSLCSRFINHPTLEKSFHTFPHDELIPLMQMFFWLKEEEPIVTIGRLVISHPLREASFSDFTAKLVLWKRVLDLARSSEQGIKTLTSIIDHCTTRLRDTLKSKMSWALPYNPGVQNAEVNEFLMADKQSGSFGSYAFRTGALNFGKRMITKANWGVEYKAVLVGARFACEFNKTKQYPPPKEYLKSVGDEIQQLTTLRTNLLNKLRMSAMKTSLKRTPLGTNQDSNIIPGPLLVKKKLFVVDENVQSPAKKRRVV